MTLSSNIKTNILGFINSLAHDYQEPIYVIYEYLQNADDYEATSCKINISDDCLILEHNGKLFDQDDANKFIQLYGSTKRFSKDYTGGFGRGAFSAFVYFTNIEVQSSSYNIHLNEKDRFSIDTKSNCIDVNRFILTYRKTSLEYIENITIPTSNKYLWTSVFKSNLSNLAQSLLFCKSLNKIQILQDDNVTEISSKNISDTHKTANVVRPQSTHSFEFKYKNFDCEPRSGKVGVLYSLADKKKELYKSGQFMNKLPLHQPTGVGLFIDGPFLLTQTRDAVPVKGENDISKHNRAIIRNAIQAFTNWISSDTVHWIENNMFNDIISEEWIKISSRNLSSEQSYLRKEIKRQLNECKIIPLSNNTYTEPKKINKEVIYLNESLLTNWPFLCLVKNSNNCSLDKILNLCGIKYSNAKILLESFYTHYSNHFDPGSKSLWGTLEEVAAWQHEAASIIKKLSSKDRKHFIKKFQKIPIIISQDKAYTCPQNALIAANNVLDDFVLNHNKTVVDIQNNDSDFINLFQLDTLDKYILHVINKHNVQNKIKRHLQDNIDKNNISKQFLRAFLKIYSGWRTIDNKSRKSLNEIILIKDDSLKKIELLKDIIVDHNDEDLIEKLSFVTGIKYETLIPIDKLRKTIIDNRKSKNIDALKSLLKYTASNWKSISKNIHANRIPQTFFTRWLPQKDTQKLQSPSELFCKDDEIVDLLGDNIPMLDTSLDIHNNDVRLFIMEIGIKTKNDISYEDMLNVLKSNDVCEWVPQQISILLSKTNDYEKLKEDFKEVYIAGKKVRPDRAVISNALFINLCNPEYIIPKEYFKLSPMFWESIGVKEHVNYENLIHLLVFNKRGHSENVIPEDIVQIRQHLNKKYPDWIEKLDNNLFESLLVKCMSGNFRPLNRVYYLSPELKSVLEKRSYQGNALLDNNYWQHLTPREQQYLQNRSVYIYETYSSPIDYFDIKNGRNKPNESTLVQYVCELQSSIYKHTQINWMIVYNWGQLQKRTVLKHDKKTILVLSKNISTHYVDDAKKIIFIFSSSSDFSHTYEDIINYLINKRLITSSLIKNNNILSYSPNNLPKFNQPQYSSRDVIINTAITFFFLFFVLIVINFILVETPLSKNVLMTIGALFFGVTFWGNYSNFKEYVTLRKDSKDIYHYISLLLNSPLSVIFLYVLSCLCLAHVNSMITCVQKVFNLTWGTTGAHISNTFQLLTTYMALFCWISVIKRQKGFIRKFRSSFLLLILLLSLSLVGMFDPVITFVTNEHFSQPIEKIETPVDTTESTNSDVAINKQNSMDSEKPTISNSQKNSEEALLHEELENRENSKSNINAEHTLGTHQNNDTKETEVLANPNTQGITPPEDMNSIETSKHADEEKTNETNTEIADSNDLTEPSKTKGFIKIEFHKIFTRYSELLYGFVIGITVGYIFGKTVRKKKRKI